MIFSSVLFLFIFLPITLLVYYISPKKIRNVILLLASLLFYAWGEPIYVLLMIFTIVFNYYNTLVISSSKPRKRKRVLIQTIVVDLLILGFFKYYGFMIDNINSIFSLSIEHKALALPLGISFYTFQTLSYVIDVYMKKVNVQKNLISFGVYVAMFPQLISGPIVRYLDLEKQIDTRKESIDKFGQGAERFIIGLGKKMLIANNIGMLWTTIQGQDLSSISVSTAWIGIIAYTAQIYFDFSGYTDMAIGVGMMFGFKLTENFNYPYIATSITDFWRRWHISLSTWFKIYVYIPLGGNKNGLLKQCRNLIVVWALTGLWHGANYTFIVWGLYYCLLLMIEKFVLKGILEHIPKFFRWLYTIILVMIGWVFFSAPNLTWAIDFIKVLFFNGNNAIIDSNAYYYLSTNGILLLLIALTATPVMKYVFEWIKKQREGGLVLALVIQIAIFVLSLAYLINASYSPFLYFKF